MPDTTGEHLSAGRRHGVVGTCQTGDGVEEDDHVVTALHHALCLLEYDAGDLHVTVGGLIEGRGDNLGVDGASHVGNLLGTLVDEQHHNIGLGVVGGDGVGDVLHQHGLTGLGLCHDEGTLTFTDGREEIDDAHAGVRRGPVAAEGEFLLGEERCQVLEGHAVAHLGGVTAVDVLHAAHSEVFLVLMGRTDGTLYDVAGLQAVFLDLLGRYVHIVGRREVVVV